MQIGVGLWTMRSTVYEPSAWSRLYADLREDARLAEALGFDSLWLGEHHGWYDGWCPQPLIAAATVLGCTDRLRAGTAMLLLPQHDVEEVSREVNTLLGSFGDRLDLGVGLGYRDAEFDVVGLARHRRGKLMDSGLDRLLAAHSDRWPSPPPVWVGGVAEAAVRRAGVRGLSLLLPNSVRPEQIVSRRGFLQTAARSGGRPPGRVGMLVDTWITTDGEAGDRLAALDRIVRHHREYTAAWFTLEGQIGFQRPDLMDKQAARTRSAAIVGPVDHILERLRELHALGIDAFVLNVRTDFPGGAHRRVMRDLAEGVLPGLRAGEAADVGTRAAAVPS